MHGERLTGRTTTTDRPETTMTTTRQTPVLSPGSDLFGALPADTQVGQISTHGETAHVYYLLNQDEHDRRRETGVAPLSPGPLAGALPLYRALLNLPAGEPTPVTALTGQEKATLRRAPVGAVTIDREQAQRHVVPPLRALAVLVEVTALDRAAVTSAGYYASFVPMVGMYVTGSSVDPMAQVQAESYGHGIAYATAEGTQVGALPERRDLWVTEAGWWWSESVYGMLTV